MWSKSIFQLIDGILDENHQKGSYMQRLERLGATAAIVLFFFLARNQIETTIDKSTHPFKPPYYSPIRFVKCKLNLMSSHVL